MVKLEEKVVGPITLNGAPQFCEDGEALALFYLNEAQAALRKSDAYPNESWPKNRVVRALEKLITHGGNCSKCSGVGV